MILAESKPTGNPLHLLPSQVMGLDNIEHIISENSNLSSPRNSLRNFQKFSSLKANSSSQLLSYNSYNNFGSNGEILDAPVEEDKNNGDGLKFYSSRDSNFNPELSVIYRRSEVQNFNEINKINNLVPIRREDTNIVALPMDNTNGEHRIKNKNINPFLFSNYLTYNKLSLEDTEI